MKMEKSEDDVKKAGEAFHLFASHLHLHLHYICTLTGLISLICKFVD